MDSCSNLEIYVVLEFSALVFHPIHVKGFFRDAHFF